MDHQETRTLQPRLRTLGSMVLAAAAVAVIGFTTVAPAKADYDDWRWRRNWHEREWREHEWRQRHAYGYFHSYPSYSYPYHGYYSYPSYGYYYPYSGYDYYR